MSYKIKEMFYTLQGEGAQTGRASVFCRFTGCNLWSGLEKHREKAKCKFCDTDFVGTDGENGGKFETAGDLADKLQSLWTDQNTSPYVVFTGGEPTLQLDLQLVNTLKKRGFIIAIETNGTKNVPPGVDWVCVSPKPGYRLKQNHGHEIKLVYPQAEPEMAPQNFEDLSFDFFYLQPMAGQHYRENLAKTIAYCQDNPKWRLSLQTHKIVGLP